MKYCINYTDNFKYVSMTKEIIFKYSGEDFFIKLNNFLQKNENFQNKTLIIFYQDKDLIDLTEIIFIKELEKEYPNLKIKVKLPAASIDADVTITNLKENNISFFFHYFINNWDELRGVLNIGVSDVYITDDLCFSMEKVSNLVHSYNTQLRVFPDIAQSTWKDSMPLKKFFIRPEDIPLYKKYIDVCEFWINSFNINTIFEVYVLDKKWEDDLSYIIKDFKYEINNRCLPLNFAEGRINCNKDCIKERKSCHICEKTLKLAEILEQKDYVFNYNN